LGELAKRQSVMMMSSGVALGRRRRTMASCYFDNGAHPRMDAALKQRDADRKLRSSCDRPFFNAARWNEIE